MTDREHALRDFGRWLKQHRSGDVMSLRFDEVEALHQELMRLRQSAERLRRQNKKVRQKVERIRAGEDVADDPSELLDDDETTS